MTRAAPWETLNQCIAVLTQRRDVLSAQIAALQALGTEPGSRGTQILLRYLVAGSAQQAAAWANAEGWCLPGAKGNQRAYTAKDVADLVANPPAELPDELVDLIRTVFMENRQFAHRRFN